MRKVLYLFMLLCIIANVAKAQIPVTHTTGTQPYGPGPINVTVQRFNNPNTNTQCGAGPYWIGLNNSNSYRFTFSQPVTHVYLDFSRVHNDDQVAIRVNGVPHFLNATDILPFAGTCALPASSASIGGFLESGVAPTGNVNGAGASLVISNRLAPYTITSIDVEHIQSGSGGVVFSFAFEDDSCKLPFPIIASDSTPCSGRCISLQTPKLPNTTVKWGTIGVIGSFPLTPDTFYKRICPVNITHLGSYTVEATRGACTYRDTIFLQPKNTPAPPTASNVNYPNGVCRGADDTLAAQTTLGGGGDYYWYRKNGLPIKGWPGNPVNSRVINIADFQLSDAGDYCAYAVSAAPDLCPTDTVCVSAFMLPDVVADFEILPEIYGCDADTARIQNRSIGATQGYIWRIFDENGALLTTRSDATEFWEQVYIIQKPNNKPTERVYVIELVALNVACRDSTKDSSKYLHPLTAGFKLNKDMVCQGYEGDSIFFEDTTTIPVGGLHQYTWTFGEPGSPSSDKDKGVKWLYTLTGTWRAKLVVKDYLGCVDSAWRDIFVDSTGPILFTPSDTVVCAGKKIEFRGDLNRVGLESSYWSFGNGLIMKDTANTVFNYDEPGIYTVSFNADYRVCRDTFAKVDIRVKPFPLINVGPDTSICQYGEPVKVWDRINHPLNTSITPGVKWHWNTPSGIDTNAVLWVRHPGVYAATAILDGCTTTDSITVSRNCYLDIPNAFTPDGDGNNDYFLPRQLLGKSVASFKMTIVNRWGQKVFETNNINGRGWDGNFNNEKQPTGVYVYMLEVAFANEKARLEKYEGNVTLLR